MSISAWDNNIKLWNINNCECILNMINEYKFCYIFSACFLDDNGKGNICISTTGINFESSFPIEVYNFNKDKIKIINNSYGNSYFINTYYDKKFNKNYIITCNDDYIKSFDYTENKLYNKYSDKLCNYNNIIINNNKNLINLISSGKDGIIRIWDFHLGNLIKKIIVNINNIYNSYGMCLWDNENLFIGYEDNTIKLINLEENKTIKNLVGHKDIIISIKKIYHSKYGECLISQGIDNIIKLWAINK